jgi:lysozyme
MLKVEVSQNQFDALCSFAYNLGLGALHGSILLKKLNEGKDSAEVAAEFLKWDHVDGVQVAGLTKRRRAEQDLFLKQ